MLNSKKPNFGMDALEFLSKPETLKRASTDSDNHEASKSRRDMEYDRVYDTFVQKLDQSLFGDFDLFLQIDLKQGRYEFNHGE